jgi:hypothetical protein
MTNRIRFASLLVLFIFAVAGNSFSQSFKLQCNGEIIQVLEQNDVPLSYGLNTYKYARVEYNGEPLNMEITVSGFEFNNSDWEISPKSYGIEGAKTGNKLSFTISRTGYLVVRFKKNQDFTKRLVIFIEPPEQMPEGELVDIIKTYDVDNTGKINETEKIQKALNDISGSGKVLYFPDGLYKSFMLQIRSNSKIHLAKNSRIIADASSMQSYLNTDNAGTNRFVFIKDAHNIQVTGFGGFDGNGTYFRGVFDPNGSQGKGAMRVLFIVNSKNIVFDGILLKDAARWSTQILGSEDIIFRNCKMMNNPNQSKNLTNFDGWDPDASKRVLIENCFGWAGDDNIAIKCVGTGNPKNYNDVEDITIRGCVFLTKKSSLKIGTETRCANMKRIIFEDNDIIESDRVMAIDVKDNAIVDGVLFKNNRAEYHFPDSKKMGINIYLKKRIDDQPTLGKILNVTIEDCSFENKFPNKFRIYRDETQTQAHDLQVTIKNLLVGKKQIEFLNPDFFDLPVCNGVIQFK